MRLTENGKSGKSKCKQPAKILSNILPKKQDNIVYNLTLRIFIFLFGLICIALGVATISSSLLGATPIAAIPFSLSIVFPKITFGIWLILFNFTLLFMEFILLKGKMRLLNIIIQCILVCFFGTCVDLSMWLVKFVFSPYTYVYKICMVTVGSFILAFGSFLTIRSNVALLPVDGFLMAISQITAINFSRLRLISDVCMSVIAIVICLLGVNALVGVREGTILASVLTGPFIKFFLHLSGMQKK